MVSLATYSNFQTETLPVISVPAMAAYNTRAISRPAGYYCSFNSRSTADAYGPVSPACLSSGKSDYYEVQRLVSSRLRKVM